MSIKGFHQYLAEMSLTRVWQHFTDPSTPSGILSASKGDKRPDENARRTLELAGKIRSAGYGYVYVDGRYIEPGHGPVEETSIAVFGPPGDSGKLKGNMRQWRADYEQDSVLFKPEGTSHAYLLYADKKEEDIGTFHPNRVAQFMTALRHTPGTFVFEAAYVTKNFFGRLLQDRVSHGDFE